VLSAPSAVLRSGLRVVLGGAFAVGPEAAPPSQALHYIHPDHLGTPRLVTDANQTIVWRWDSSPFGETLPNEDPDGDGHAVVLNLRFPGQYYDQETGLSYNYFRDYDAGTGRYVESDPIGLDGGLGTYLYALNNPNTFVDPTGGAAVLPAIPIIIKVCEATAAAMIGTFTGVAIVETVHCEHCDKHNNDDKCRKAIQDARRIYNRLVIKKIPQYMYGTRTGSADDGHLRSIHELQDSLREALGRVRLYCKILPPEYPKWERLANQDFPQRH